MKLNGIYIFLEKGQNLFDFLTAQNFDISKIAVERNGEIVPRTAYHNVMLSDEDTLEVVRFVGGG